MPFSYLICLVICCRNVSTSIILVKARRCIFSLIGTLKHDDMTRVDLTMAKGKKGARVQQGHTQQAGWISPPEGLVRINVDAATSKNTDRGAAAAVARSSEALALCIEAAALSRDLLLRKVMVASDCINCD